MPEFVSGTEFLAEPFKYLFQAIHRDYALVTKLGSDPHFVDFHDAEVLLLSKKFPVTQIYAENELRMDILFRRRIIHTWMWNISLVASKDLYPDILKLLKLRAIC